MFIYIIINMFILQNKIIKVILQTGTASENFHMVSAKLYKTLDNILHQINSLTPNRQL